MSQDPPERVYRVTISRRVAKDIERFPARDFERVTNAILALDRGVKRRTRRQK